MKHINELAAILNHHFNWNKARVTCLAQIIKGLIAVKTVNLVEIATSFSSSTKSSSSYRRIQRFFLSFDFPMGKIIDFIFCVLPSQERLILIMDRTNWKLGNAHLNFLVLSIAYRGIAIPIYWLHLRGPGTSHTTHRIYAMVKVLQKIKKNRIFCLVADREFIGGDWFSWLEKSGINFVIRIRGNSLAKRHPEDRYPTNVSQLFRGLKNERHKHLKKPFWLNNLPLYLSASRSPEGELLIVATPRFNRSVLKTYKKRWEIENLFSAFKSKGFNLEDTHMIDAQKLEKLLFVLTIALCWAYAVGIDEDRMSNIPVKSHRRKSKSIIRCGYEALRKALFRGPNIFRKYYRFLVLLTTCSQGRKSNA